MGGRPKVSVCYMFGICMLSFGCVSFRWSSCFFCSWDMWGHANSWNEGHSGKRCIATSVVFLCWKTPWRWMITNSAFTNSSWNKCGIKRIYYPFIGTWLHLMVVSIIIALFNPIWTDDPICFVCSSFNRWIPAMRHDERDSDLKLDLIGIPRIPKPPLEQTTNQ